MPELPEVETIRRHLAPFLVGRRIKNVLLNRRDIVGFPGLKRFRLELAGMRIKGVGRRGKYLIFDLTENKSLILHLRLSGHLR
ncbi:MAG: DNA-formamidopyrimidine glycosylase family protein, partial [candidate division WOR-3 bacterium]